MINDAGLYDASWLILPPEKIVLLKYEVLMSGETGVFLEISIWGDKNGLQKMSN